MTAKGDGLDPIRECLDGLRKREVNLGAMQGVGESLADREWTRGNASAFGHAARLLAAAIERAEGPRRDDPPHVEIERWLLDASGVDLDYSPPAAPSDALPGLAEVMGMRESFGAIRCPNPGCEGGRVRLALSEFTGLTHADCPACSPGGGS